MLRSKQLVAARAVVKAPGPAGFSLMMYLLDLCAMLQVTIDKATDQLHRSCC
jgi:hypothetical protein